MSPEEARRLAAVYLIPEHPGVRVGEARSIVGGWDESPRPPYDVAVTIDGKPGTVRVAGSKAHQVRLVTLDGLSTSRDLVRVGEPAT